jgi:hypothetical protein
MMSPGSGTIIHLQQWMRGRHPRLFQGRGKQLAQKTMITIFFTVHQLILSDVLPKGNKLISSISSITCFLISKRKTGIFVVECRLQLFGCTLATMGQNSTSIRLHDRRTHPIRQT